MKILILISLVILSLTSTALVSAEDQAYSLQDKVLAKPGIALEKPEMATARAGSQDSLQLEIAAEKSEFALGEPVILYISLENAGDKPVEVKRFLEPEFGYVVYNIRGPDGEEKPFLPWMYKEHSEPQQTLAPGEAVQGVARIFYGGNGWTFRESGAYQVQAVYEDSILSNQLTLNILASSDQKARQAADLFLGSDEVGKFLLFEGGDHLIDGMSRLSQVATQLPDTSLASYANYALGANLMNDFANFQENRLRPAEPVQAVSYLARAMERPASVYYTTRAGLYLTEGDVKLGDAANAKEALVDTYRLVGDQLQTFKPITADELRLNELSSRLNVAPAGAISPV